MANLADLPPHIVPAVEALAQRLTEHVRTQRDASLERHEAGVLEAWRAVASQVLSGVVAAATTGADPQARPPRSACPSCGLGVPIHRWRARTVHTRLGTLQLVRSRYRCAPCERSWSRADQTLGLPAWQRTSAGLARWAAQLGGLTTFREAAGLLEELAGIGLGAETLRTHAERVGTELEGVQQRAMADLEATQEWPAKAEYAPAPGQLVVETDGVLVRYQDRSRDGSPWHEVKLGVVGGWTIPTADSAAGHLVESSYVAAREKAARFARRLGAEAARRGALDVVGWRGQTADGGGAEALLRPVVVLGDGAKWIWQEAAATFGNERTEIVDWWHASKHLWDLSKALHGAETPETTAWAEHATHLLWHQGPLPLRAFLRQTRARTPAAAKSLQRERTFFTSNACRMTYPAFRQAGLPVGSGAVEGGAKHLVQQRLKRAGMRWSEPGARAILHLRCHSLSGHSLDTLPAAA